MKYIVLLSGILPVCHAQFGVGRNRNANFQELQELAKKGGAAAGGGVPTAGGGMDDWAAQLQAMMEDPSYLDKYGEMGSQMASAMEEMMKLTPAEMAKQMEEAMKMIMNEETVESVVNQREEVLKSLETSGMVPPEELVKFKADPNYFEQKMRESFHKMGEIFSDKDTLTKTAEMMKGLTDLMSDPSALNKLSEAIQEHIHDDGKIEEMRQALLKGELEGMGALQQMFNNMPEMADILSDPKKFRSTVQDGMNLMNKELKDEL